MSYNWWSKIRTSCLCRCGVCLRCNIHFLFCEFVSVTSLLCNVTAFVSARMRCRKINRLFTVSVDTVRPADAGDEATGQRMPAMCTRIRDKCCCSFWLTLDHECYQYSATYEYRSYGHVQYPLYTITNDTSSTMQRAFVGFQEGTITFPPSYRMNKVF